jgi:hypothetical protein
MRHLITPPRHRCGATSAVTGYGQTDANGARAIGAVGSQSNTIEA